MSKLFRYDLKVFYEDTDAGGVVYYANYLKFLERARSEAIYSLGFSNTQLKENFGIVIIVKSCNINYIKSAVFEDKLSVFSSLKKLSNTSFIMQQEIKRDEELLSTSEICLVCINREKKPTKIPDELKSSLKDFIN
tara:strand:- start:589 stop:996 length:408 start_codon:yes stop_codon:yes gene_type:complete